MFFAYFSDREEVVSLALILFVISTNACLRAFDSPKSPIVGSVDSIDSSRVDPHLGTPTIKILPSPSLGLPVVISFASSILSSVLSMWLPRSDG